MYTPSSREGSTSLAIARSAGVYRSVRSTKFAPTSGVAPVKLIWSRISTGVPGRQDGSMPPQPLVSTIVRAPVAAAVRTPCTTASTPAPS